MTGAVEDLAPRVSPEFDLGTLDQLPPGETGVAATSCFRTALCDLAQTLQSRFAAGTDADALVHLRASVVTRILERSWQLFGLDETPHALAAVGGFGRGELHPCSDVDIAVLLAGDPDAETGARLERWLTFLWDIGLEVGQSVRTPEQSAELAAGDITIATNLMEARLIAGNPGPFEAMRRLTSPAYIWPTRAFFEAKLAEQEARYRKFDDAYGQLEPNIKASPGGLRDIQNISWVANRHFRAAGLDGLVTHGFLTEDEYAALEAGRRFLWKVRCALHFEAGRREDRLMFDLQRAVAKLFGYEGEGNDAVEAFMRTYYRTVRELSSLNDMLLGLFREAIIEDIDDAEVKPVNRRFQVRNGLIEARSPKVFARNPQALLEVFLLIQQHPEIAGVRASTIRLIRESLHLIDDAFREDIRSRSLFMEIVRQPRHIGHELRRMHRYGVLGAYLPAFERVSGLMQFDLFHVYTVDEHTLFLVRNLRSFSYPDDEVASLPHCQEAIGRVPKLEVIYIAGLFHDIAKGRGGDHSELGAEEAVKFCRDHGFSNYDTHIVAWLVRNHLLMSATAQRKDIYDPVVIAEFAREVGDLVHLDYLYLLTVADIRATNPNLWTSWKSSLLSELFTSTRRIMRRSTRAMLDPDEQIAAVKSEARAWLAERNTRLPAGRLERFWKTLDAEYFTRHRAEEIAWHAAAVLGADEDELPVVATRTVPERGCTAIFIYTRDMENLFAITTAAIGRLRLDIQDARIITTDGGYTLDTYMVLDADGGGVELPRERRTEIQQRIRDAILHRHFEPARGTVGLLRKHRHFRFRPSVEFSRDERHGRTVMEVIAVDQPALLSNIGIAMNDCGASLAEARIATFGERVEDYFYITDREGRPYSAQARQNDLRKAIVEALG